MTESDWEKELEKFRNLHDVICNVRYERECNCDMNGLKIFFKKIFSSATSQGAMEAVIKIQTHFFQLWEDDIDTISIKKVIDYLNSISPSKEVEEK